MTCRPCVAFEALSREEFDGAILVFGTTRGRKCPQNVTRPNVGPTGFDCQVEADGRESERRGRRARGDWYIFANSLFAVRIGR